jgi:serine protease AprX
LWGKRGRGPLLTTIAALALVVPMGAAADGGDSSGGGKSEDTFVAPGLLEGAKRSPEKKIKVIISAKKGSAVAKLAFRLAGKSGKGGGEGRLKRDLNLVDGIAVELPAARLEKIARFPGLIIAPDAPVRVSGGPLSVGGFSTGQLWPIETGNTLLWATDKSASVAANMPAIAIVDSGVDTTRPDLAGRVVADVKLNGDAPGDSRGHGTFVAGIAAGSANGYAGAAPTAKIVSIDVMDQNGMASTSDVIAAAEWILANKDRYKIRVANFSLHSARMTSFRWDPLNKAVQKLWFGGVTVVAAAGNYGKADGPSGVVHAPGNDPFVITVGALDLGGTFRWNDDAITSWSAYGHTLDGFAKPEIAAAGRYMIGPVPVNSTLPAERPERVIAPGYMELSGTSFAAPVVAGTAAQILARHPEYTPDMVKGALMLTARKVHKAQPLQAGVGQVTAILAANLRSTPPNPNAALNAFVVPDPTGGSVPAFDDAAWANAAWSNAAWSNAAWSSAAWSSAAWSSAAWSNAAWSNAAWNTAAWQNVAEFDAAWNAAAWASVSYEDAAEGDEVTGGEEPTPEAEAATEPIFSDDDGVAEEPAPAATAAVTDAAAAAATTVASTLP